MNPGAHTVMSSGIAQPVRSKPLGYPSLRGGVHAAGVAFVDLRAFRRVEAERLDVAAGVVEVMAGARIDPAVV